MYKFLNRNSHQRFVDDCTVRAISLAENRTWNETYDKLSNMARSKGMMFNSVEFIEDYLDYFYLRECHTSKTVGEFAYENSKGTYLVTMPNHITVIIDGVVYDTFDCSDRIMRCAWKIPVDNRTNI